MSASELARGSWLVSVTLLALATTGGCSTPPGHQAPDSPSSAGSSFGGGGQAASAGEGGGAGTGGAAHPVKTSSRRSGRGAGCSVKNDCAEGLSCVRGVCEPTSFGLSPSAKECVQIDCTTSADCCGKLSEEIPAKCQGRAALCLQTLPGCVVEPCARSRDCAGGGVCTGHCSITSGECSGNVDCLANKCLGGSCSLSFTACGTDADCGANVCTGGSCACDNPSYEPANPLCADEECDGLCLWSCQGSRCVIPEDCRTDDECFGARPMCVEGGCVECADDVDCSFDKVCRAGSCETPCESDANCPLFEACQAGECIHVGCRSDRECTLLPDVNALELPSGFDPRLLRCHTEDGVGRCLIPCQTDAQCAVTEICSGGLCKYIGCETSAECKTIIGLHDQVATDEHPWLSSAECRADEAK